MKDKKKEKKHYCCRDCGYDSGKLYFVLGTVLCRNCLWKTIVEYEPFEDDVADDQET